MHRSLQETFPRSWLPVSFCHLLSLANVNISLVVFYCPYISTFLSSSFHFLNSSSYNSGTESYDLYEQKIASRQHEN